ncbi:alpha amylase C-terminal domain-containing protein, partial [Arthrospira platensis SPKY1]|nr:alpha amylase C-terminal domain-containing protein [Arthrospira platensis SPKY1]
MQVVANDNPRHVVSFSRQKDGNEVFVVINLSDTMQWATLKKESPSALYREHFSGELFTLEYGTRIALRPWDHLVFIFEKNNPLPKRQLKSIEQESDGIRINTTDGLIYLRPHSGSALEVEYVADGTTNPPSYALADSAGNVNATLREFD